MDTVTLAAHFDGKKIVLDEPFKLRPDAKLLVTVLAEKAISDEHETWLLLSQNGLERAYGENEPEYSFGSEQPKSTIKLN